MDDELRAEKAAVQRRIDFCFRHMRREHALQATESFRLYARLVKLVLQSQALIVRPTRYELLMQDEDGPAEHCGSSP